MIAAIRFTVQLHYLWLVLCLATSCLSFAGVQGMGLASTLFLWFFIYRLNVEDKAQGTWSYFHSLPITFGEKIVLRVGLPLVLSIAVSASTSRQFHPLLLYVRDDFRWDIMNSTLLVLSSLMARSLIGYLLTYFGLVIFAMAFRNVGSFDFVLIVAAIGASVYYLSEKRISGKLIFTGILCLALPAWLLSAAFDRPLLSHLLRSKTDKMQMEAAVWLASKDDDAEARKYFETRLRAVTDFEQLKTLIANLNRAGRPLSLTAQDWRDIAARIPAGKGFVLGYLLDHGQDYPWWSAAAMEAWEPLVLTGSSECEDACELLADIIVGHMQDGFDYDRLKPMLVHNAPGDQVGYALKILESSETPKLVKELKSLRSNPSGEVRVRAENILENWKG